MERQGLQLKMNRFSQDYLKCSLNFVKEDLEGCLRTQSLCFELLSVWNFLYCLSLIRTVYYLEYKLAKLLVCPLDENYPVNRYAIRGYSRQSDSTAVSSIPSFPSTNRESPGVRRDVLLRCPSQTRSTPAYLGKSACKLILQHLKRISPTYLNYFLISCKALWIVFS